MTHYHFDHSGGLRGWIAQGATIVTTAGNKAFVEQVAAAKHTIRPDDLSRTPKPATVETFTGKRVFSPGDRAAEPCDARRGGDRGGGADASFAVAAHGDELQRGVALGAQRLPAGGIGVGLGGARGPDRSRLAPAFEPDAFRLAGGAQAERFRLARR